MSEPIGEYEMRDVTQLRQGDHVWDDDLRRWRRITSVFAYDCSRSKQHMVKIVLDISTWYRINVTDVSAQYAVLTGAMPDAFAPRARSRRQTRSDDVPADTSSNVSDTPVRPVQTSSGTATSVTDVRARRDALRLSRKAFAELAGVTPGALWRIEQGRGTADEMNKVTSTLDGLERT